MKRMVRLPRSIPVESAHIAWLRFVPHLVVTGIVLYLINLLEPVLLPFLLGATMAYFGDPVVDKLETKKLSRTISVCIVFTVFSLIAAILMLIFIPLLAAQIEALVSNLPSYLSKLQASVLPWLNETFGIKQQALTKAEIGRLVTANWDDFQKLFASAIQSLSRSGGTILSFFAGIALVPIVTFYLLRDWDILVEKIRELLPVKIEPSISKWAKESDEVLGSFMRGQLLVMICLSFIYSIGLYAVGLEYGLLIGVIAGMVSFVPYLGSAVGITLATAMMWLQTGEVLDLALVSVVFVVGQMAEGMLLTPLLVGDRIGLHPVAVIFAVLAGGQLFGFLGILLALPVSAVLAVALRHWRDDYMKQQRAELAKMSD